ncbi:alpha/beta fold hydrolase [Roseivirga sp. BDSF3-8]|uniref:alpha/beta fold hydrolase n=1 Tax=Roseivirga sp. BDSF3-8 TaxID=3241598 RepID=UPI00353200BB
MLYHKVYNKNEAADWVVFVHGAGGSSSIWYKQVREYRKEFNVLLVDLRGHGRSQNLMEEYFKDPYSFDVISQDVLQVLDYLQIEKAHFVGISLGTIIIRNIGEIAPERVASLIMGGAIARLNFRSRFFVSLGNLFKKVVPFMWLYRFFAWIIMPKQNHKESRSLFIREAQRVARKEFLRWFRLTGELTPLLRIFHENELKAPILYIMGSEDHMFLGPVKELVKNQKNSALRVIQDCGHVVNVECPDIFNEASMAFIGQNDSNNTQWA